MLQWDVIIGCNIWTVWRQRDEALLLINISLRWLKLYESHPMQYGCKRKKKIQKKAPTVRHFSSPIDIGQKRQLNKEVEDRMACFCVIHRMIKVYVKSIAEWALNVCFTSHWNVWRRTNTKTYLVGWRKCGLWEKNNEIMKIKVAVCAVKRYEKNR